MRALVTGHEGFVGRHLVPKLVRAGYDVHGTENLQEFLRSPLATQTWDVVVHLAANIINVHDRGKIGMRAFDDIQLDLTMFKWIESNPPAKIFVAMSSCALDFPEDPYCMVKITLESFAQCLRKQNVPVVILRPFSGYGADQSLEYPFPAILARARRREDPLLVWGGSQVRDWIHIEDLTDANRLRTGSFSPWRSHPDRYGHRHGFFHVGKNDGRGCRLFAANCGRYH